MSRTAIAFIGGAASCAALMLAAVFWFPELVTGLLRNQAPALNSASESASPLSSANANQRPSASSNGGSSPRPVMIDAVPVILREIADEVSAIGSLRASRSVTISPEISGRLAEFSVKGGTFIRQGEVIARLDQSVSAAELAQAKSGLSLARANFERAQALVTRGSGTQQALDEARAQLQTQEASLAVAEARHAKTVITAPFDGVVGLPQVDIGQYLNAGTDIVNLSTLDPLEIEFRIPEVHALALSIGQSVTLTLDSLPGIQPQGTIQAIAPVIDESTRSVLVQARLPNPELILKPGFFAKVQITVSPLQSRLLIPEEAVIIRDGQPFVYKYGDDGSVQLQAISIAARRGAEVEIASGLSEADLVVTSGQMKLRPGTKVSIRNESMLIPGRASQGGGDGAMTPSN